MSLFLSLLPLYLLGNFHCASMCGPLVMLLAKNRFRGFYFLGRGVAFGGAGLVAGQVGLVAGVGKVPVVAAFLLSLVLVAFGVMQVMGWRVRLAWLERRSAGVSAKLAGLVAEEKVGATFLFGLMTVVLPCGQSMVVFSACAVAGDPWVGLFNGLAFAALTSPGLFFAGRLFRRWGSPRVVGGVMMVVGVLSLCRGLAHLEVVPHLSIPKTHIVFF